MHALTALAVVRFGLVLQLGAEYDSNANRAEVVADAVAPDTPTGSFLLRTTGQGRLTWRRDLSLLSLSAGFGGKVFFNPDVADQDVLIGQLSVDERVRIWRAAFIGVGGDYYDASQLDVGPTSRHRDFRAG